MYYSQTLENRSSPPPNPPPAGFDEDAAACGGLEAAGETGAALLHPPKSSSGVTLGGAFGVLPDPTPNEDCPVVVSEPPQAEKSLARGIGGAFVTGAGATCGLEG